MEEEVLTEEQKIINQFDLELYKDDMMESNELEKKEDKNDLCSNVKRRIWKIKKRIWKSIKLNCLQSNSI